MPTKGARPAVAGPLTAAFLRDVSSCPAAAEAPPYASASRVTSRVKRRRASNGSAQALRHGVVVAVRVADQELAHAVELVLGLIQRLDATAAQLIVGRV